MAIDRTGALSNVKRHDYLPYGEELYAGMGGRTSQQGYVADNLRQKFTGYEHDAETNLEFAQARYYYSSCGRFTSPDPYSGSMSLTDPQSFNRYSYTGNDPVNHTDPSGMSEHPAMMGMGGGTIAEMFRQGGDDHTAEGRAEYEANLEDTRRAIQDNEVLKEYPQLAAAYTDNDNAAAAAPQGTYSRNSTMVTVWDPVNGTNPSSAFGHVSY